MITNLAQSTKPLKLRHFCKETKSKILLDVCWSQLKGNKQPYLSVNSRQVKKDNIVISYNEQKEVIKEINKDFYFLLCAHLSNTDGSRMHQHANMQYHFKLAQDQFGKEIYTSEKHNKKASNLLYSLQNHELFSFLFKDFGYSKDIYFSGYLDRNSDKYLYSNSVRSIKHWTEQIEVPYNRFNIKKYKQKLESLLTDFFEGIDNHRRLTSSYKYKNLPSNRELWTPKKLSEYYNLTLVEVMMVLAETDQDNKQALIKLYSDSIKEKNLIILKELTEKYKIPVVYS